MKLKDSDKIFYTDKITLKHSWNPIETNDPKLKAFHQCKICKLIALTKPLDAYDPPAYSFYVENIAEHKDSCKIRYIRDIIR